MTENWARPDLGLAASRGQAHSPPQEQRPRVDDDDLVALLTAVLATGSPDDGEVEAKAEVLAREIVEGRSTEGGRTIDNCPSGPTLAAVAGDGAAPQPAAPDSWVNADNTRRAHAPPGTNRPSPASPADDVTGHDT